MGIIYKLTKHIPLLYGMCPTTLDEFVDKLINVREEANKLHHGLVKPKVLVRPLEIAELECLREDEWGTEFVISYNGLLTLNGNDYGKSFVRFTERSPTIMLSSDIEQARRKQYAYARQKAEYLSKKGLEASLLL